MTPDPTATTSEPVSSLSAHQEDPARPTGTRCQPSCHRPGPSHAHCTVCHRTLRTVAMFDRHRRDAGCLHPTELGLVEVDGLWATPEGHERRRRDAARLAAARERR